MTLPPVETLNAITLATLHQSFTHDVSGDPLGVYLMNSEAR